MPLQPNKFDLTFPVARKVNVVKGGASGIGVAIASAYAQKRF